MAMNPVMSETMYCLGCYYNLRGLTSDRCPECGRFFNPAHPQTFSPTPRPTPVREVMERIAGAVTQLTEISDPEEQLRRLRRSNPYFSEIFRLQQANEMLRQEVKRLTQKLKAHGLLDAKEFDEIRGLIDDSIVEFEFVEDNDDQTSEDPELMSPELLELQRAAEDRADFKAPPGNDSASISTDSQFR